MRIVTTLSKILLLFVGFYSFVLLIVWKLQEYVILHPYELPDNYTFRFNQPFEALEFKKAAATISVLRFPSTTDTTKGIIFYLHGNASNLQRYGYMAEDFTHLGYDIIMLDYRTFGKSRGVPSEAAFHADAQWILQEIMKKYNYNAADLVIYGRSLGSGVATKLASANKARLLILETPFYSIADVARRIFPFMPYNYLLRYQFKNYAYLPKVKCPTYIFHGTADKVVPYASGKKLERYLNKPEQFITIEGGEHNNLRIYPKYHHYLATILE